MCNTAHVFWWWPAAAVGSAALVTGSIQSSELSSTFLFLSLSSPVCFTFCPSLKESDSLML